MFAQYFEEVKRAGGKETSVVGSQLPASPPSPSESAAKYPLFQQAFLGGMAVHGRDELLGWVVGLWGSILVVSSFAMHDRAVQSALCPSQWTQARNTPVCHYP